MEAERRAESDEVSRGRRRGSGRVKFLKRCRSVEGAGRDDRGWTPLHVACHTGSLKQVQALLEEGADVDGQSAGPKHPGATPLHLAAASGHLEVMDLLLESGANIEARTRGSFGWTPLHLAAKGDRQHAVRFLLENGAFLAPDMRDLRFNPPLHYCRGKGLEYAYECYQELQHKLY